MLYICTMFCQSISKDFSYRPEHWVNARVVPNVDDGHTDRRLNGQKTRSLYRLMHETGATTNNVVRE